MGQAILSPTANPGIVSSIPAWSHTLVTIDHEIISTYFPSSADSVRFVTTEISARITD